MYTHCALRAGACVGYLHVPCSYRTKWISAPDVHFGSSLELRLEKDFIPRRGDKTKAPGGETGEPWKEGPRGGGTQRRGLPIISVSDALLLVSDASPKEVYT